MSLRIDARQSMGATAGAERIDRHCLAFEDAWRSGATPDLAAWLEGWVGSERAQLLKELLLLDKEYRQRNGQQPSANDYLSRFPEDRSIVEEVFDPKVEEISGALRAGQRVGRYVVERQLGDGSFGYVYLAWDSELQRFVALKTPRAIPIGGGNVIEEFIEEARTASRIDHPAIVPVLDVMREASGLPVMVMPYIEGCSLRDRIAERPMRPDDAARLLIPVAEAMDFAHHRGFVHRDLKPRNILLDLEGRPHITDFGLAIHESNQDTRAGESAGSLAYMSPEQLRGDSQWLDGRSDIWALGVILYEMLTGRRPFGGKTCDELASEIFVRDPKPLRQIDAAIPIEYERICLTCLSKPVAGRYATARDFAEALRQAANEHEASSSRSGRTAPWGRLLRRFMWLIVAIAIGFGAAAVWLAGVGRQREIVVRGPVAQVKDIELSVWTEQELYRGRINRREASGSPLHSGNKVRLSVTLNRPAYLYVLWIGIDGDVTPIFPWRTGDWTKRGRESRLTELRLPDAADQSWRVEHGASGTETIVALVSDRPLPADLDVSNLAAPLTAQSGIELSVPQWYDEGGLVPSGGGTTRSPNVRQPVKLHSPLVANQLLMKDKLSPHTVSMQAICFPISGE